MGARILPPHALCDSLATSRNVGATRGASFLCCWQHAIQVAILRRSSCDGQGGCATCIFEESMAVDWAQRRPAKLQSEGRHRWGWRGSSRRRWWCFRGWRSCRLSPCDWRLAAAPAWSATVLVFRCQRSHFTPCTPHGQEAWNRISRRIPPHGLEARNRASRRISPHANDQLSCMIVGVVGPPVCCPRNPRVARLPAGRHASCSLPSHPHPHKVEPLHTRVIFHRLSGKRQA